MSDDPNVPRSRNGLDDDEVWEWVGNRWRTRRTPPFEEPNAGGEPGCGGGCPGAEAIAGFGVRYDSVDDH